MQQEQNNRFGGWIKKKKRTDYRQQFSKSIVGIKLIS